MYYKSGFKKIVLVLVLLAIVAGVAVPAINAQTTGQTILQNLAARPEFSSLVNLAKGTGLDGKLSGAAQYTLFAPTNTALSSIPADRVNALMNDKPKLASLVNYHVVPGKLTYANLKTVNSVKTVDGRTLPVTVKNGIVSVGGVQVLNNGIESSNGIIYPTNSIIMPPGFVLPQAQTSRSTGLPWQSLALLLGVIVLGGALLYAMTRSRRPTTYEKGYEAARPRAEEHYRAEETLRQVRETVAGIKEPNISDIAKNVDVPLSGDALTGLNNLISKGTFDNKQDFLGFLAKQYLQNNMGEAMAGGKEPGLSTIMDIIDKTGIGKGFMEGDVKKYLVPLLMAGFMAVYKYLTKQPAVKPA